MFSQSGEDSSDVARLRNNLGTAWDALGQYKKAIGYHEQALASFLKTYGEEHLNVATARNNLGAA
jgi:tetratricopeptide (TPR) repeat protein